MSQLVAGPHTADSLGAMALAAADHGRGPALTGPGGFSMSYPELARAAREIAAGLAHLGVVPGDRVALLAGTRPEWTLCDLGVLCAGAVVVPIYHTSSPAECRYIVEDSGARVILCEDGAQLAKLAGAPVAHAITICGEAPDAITLDELRGHGELDRTP
jgi:long-chain acyl-CoA synthetase